MSEVVAQGLVKHSIDGSDRFSLTKNEGSLTLKKEFVVFDSSLCANEISWIKTTTSEVEINKEKRSFLLNKNQRTFSFGIKNNVNRKLENNFWYNILILSTAGDTIFQRTQTEDSVFRVDYVPPGRYKLHVKSYENKLLSCTSVYFFKVGMRIGEYPIALAAAFLFFAFAILMKYKFRQDREKLQLSISAMSARSKAELDQLRVRALSNYFNPHFINNSLHWLQSRYRKDNEATQIIGRLSENVDILFSNTQRGKPYHSLREELILVENYIDICQKRFGDVFTIAFPDKKSIDRLGEMYLVPILCIQILVENAIEKGIAPVKSAGSLMIELSEENAGLYVIISDNGVGRQTFTDLTYYRQSSTKTLEKVIKLYNTYNERHITLQYEDNYLSSDHVIGRAHGTRVTLFFPKNFDYEFVKS